MEAAVEVLEVLVVLVGLGGMSKKRGKKGEVRFGRDELGSILKRCRKD